MDFIVRSLAVTASTGTGLTNTTSSPSSVKWGNSTQASPTPTTFRLGTAAPSGAPLQFANITQAPAVTRFNSTTFLNTTRTPDLNNATECYLQYWAESHRQNSWYQAHHTTYTINATFLSVQTTTIPAKPQGNVSYTQLCDGLPRFTDIADEQKVAIPLATPITKTIIRQFLTIDPIGTEENPYTNFPQCKAKPGEECGDIWSLFGSSRRSTLSEWSSTNVLTIFVAPTPTAITVNGEATPLTAAPGQLPALPIRDKLYTAGADSIWSIDDAYNFVGETFIVPGQQVTFTWNWDDKPRPYGPNGQGCVQPTGTIIESACRKTAQCTITAKSVDLLYFPPPSTTRDICANTSPGFNKYSQSVYQQPHQSVIINSTTFWKDKAYVRYNTVSAYRRCEADNGIQTISTSVGGTYTNTYVEVESSDLSTICGWQMNPTRPYGVVIAATPVPLNFDDLQGPVPESAWQCAPYCGIRGGCSSIVQSLFAPNLAVPPQVRSLDPDWANCVPYFEGTPDPPIALSSAGDFWTTTNPGPQPTPGVSPSANQPVETGKPGGPPDQDPSNPPNNNNPSNPPQNPPNNNNPSNPSNPGNSPQNPPQNPPNNNNPPNPGPQRPGEDPGNRPPVITTSITENIPLPTARPPTNNPSNPPNNDSPSMPNGPSNNGPNNPPNNGPNNPSNNQPNNPPANPAGNQPGTPITTIGNQPIVADPSRPGVVVVGTPGSPSATTLTPGGPPIVISGTTLSISPSGTALTVSGPSTLSPITTLNGQPVYIDPTNPGRIIVGNPNNPSAQQTYNVNNDGIVVISGTTLSLSPSATGAVQGVNSPSTVTIAGLPITMNPDGSMTVLSNGQTHTLRPGAPQISVGGHTIFLGPAGEVVVDGTPYKLNTSSTPDSVVIIGPDGSKTTVAMSRATARATSSPIAVERVESSRGSSGSTRGEESITSKGPEASGGANAPVPTSSKGGVGRVGSGVGGWIVGIGVVGLGIL